MMNKFCPTCGIEVDNENKFCSRCGTLVNNISTSKNVEIESDIFKPTNEVKVDIPQIILPEDIAFEKPVNLEGLSVDINQQEKIDDTFSNLQDDNKIIYEINSKETNTNPEYVSDMYIATPTVVSNNYFVENLGLFSMIIGIISLIFSPFCLLFGLWIVIFFMIVSASALTTGIIAVSHKKLTGFGIAGIVLGGISLLMDVFWCLCVVLMIYDNIYYI